MRDIHFFFLFLNTKLLKHFLATKAGNKKSQG